MKVPFQEALKSTVKNLNDTPEQYGIKIIVYHQKDYEFDYSLIERNSQYEYDIENFQFIELERVLLVFQTENDPKDIYLRGIDVEARFLTEESLLKGVYVYTHALNSIIKNICKGKCNKIKDFKLLKPTEYTSFVIEIQDFLD